MHFDGKVSDGKLSLWDREAFDRHLRTLSGKSVSLELKAGGSRSTQQNRYLWGTVYKILSDYTGYTPEEIHEVCKLKFLPKIIDVTNKKTGEVDSQVIGGSTVKLTTIEFAEYVEQLQRFGAEMDCVIPDPIKEPTISIGEEP